MRTTVTRRDWVKTWAGGSMAAAAYLLAKSPLAVFGADVAAEAAGEEVLPFLETAPVEVKAGAIDWPKLREWITPVKDLFSVGHYGSPTVKAEDWKLRIGGLVAKPLEFTLDQIKAMPRKEITATIECSGNGANARFMGAVGNAVWAGTPLAPLLKEAGVSPDAVEAAFWGADAGQEKIREKSYAQNFARCLTIEQAHRQDLILAYEMNGKPLTSGHGFPLRLIVPGWYGVAWVKWLTTIELRDHPLRNRFMARDYVTIRGEVDGEKTIWKESLVAQMNVKSMVARVARRNDGGLLVSGAAWGGAPIKSVEVKIDDGPWQPAKIDESHTEPFTWRFWSFDWKDGAAGEHTLVSRATDAKGHVQPAADEPAIALKKTYWEANQQYPRKVKV